MPFEKIPAEIAVYVELEGAVKDADCNTVQVEGGVSTQKGCCDIFQQRKDADHFHCGDCIRVELPSKKKLVIKKGGYLS